MTNFEKIKEFLDKLSKLSDEYNIYIKGCGCCGSPWLSDDKNCIADNLDFDKIAKIYNVDICGIIGNMHESQELLKGVEVSE
jgi:hypothetical protein